SKEVGDRYRSELEKSRAKLETLKGKAEDPREILKELEKSEKSKTSVDQVLREKENIKKSLEKNIDENINLEKSIERTGRDIETEVKILETQKSALISNDKDTLEAEESLKIVRKNSESYESYLEFQKRAGETKEKVIALEDEILNLRKKEMEIKNLEREALEISGEIEKEKIHIATNREKFQKVLELKTEEEKALLLAQNREAELESEEKNLLPLIRKGEVLENEIKNLNYLLEIEEEKSFQDKKLYLEISEKLKLSQKDAIQEKIDMLLKVAEEKTSLESEISKLQALLENSREAEKKLSTSLCPYLNEKCKNLESSSDAEEFFREREKKFTDSLKEKETKLSKVKESLETLDHLKKLKREEEIMSETLLNLGRVMEKRESEIKISQLQRENLYLQMENFQREGMSLEKLRERKITLIEEKKYLNLKNIREKIEGILREISELEKNFKILDEGKIVLEKNRIGNIEKIEVLKNEIKDLSDYEEKLGKEKRYLGNIEVKLLELKQSYDLYSRNITVALKLESFREKELFLRNNIERISFGIEKLGENLQKLREELGKKISLHTLQAEKKAVEESITDLHRESGALLSIIVALKERAKKSEEDFVEIESLEEREKKLQKKYELTLKFRENVKGMGEKVAESIIRRIAFFATENFRKITGRSESIIWSGKDSAGKDSPYSVLLEGADREGNLRKVNFDQLSGGEQVAVAISIRGAMNSIFTKTGFSIFDEPTNNLDQERRKILADNIGEILENMEQSIIVTHDDTFKEMAQQVIEL
ncbi:MAG: hypothetical protein ACRCR2_05390, partial [Fusobacteriaceae bacterium]